MKKGSKSVFIASLKSSTSCILSGMNYGIHTTACGQWIHGKTFQAAQLTHERFLTIDHSCNFFFDTYLPNWTSTNLWCVVLYVTYSTTHQRFVEVQFGKYQKNILQEWSMVKNLSCASCAAWNVFPINSPQTCTFIHWALCYLTY